VCNEQSRKSATEGRAERERGARGAADGKKQCQHNPKEVLG